MFQVSLVHRAILIALASLTSLIPSLLADSPQNQFYQAYYLENERGDYTAAADLYSGALKGRGLGPRLKAETKARLARCREELACTDFARLMPPTVLAYVEMNRPGERIGSLIDQLGLLRDRNAEPGDAPGRLEISPAILDALLGMRGAAVAITGFDPRAQQPTGVGVFHPGDMELVRGLIETALPVATEQVQSVGGFPTYEIEGVLVTLTARLVVVGTSEGEIEGVIDRLQSDDAESLATNPDMNDVLEARDSALLFFCVNPKPLMPLLNAAFMAGASQDRGLAIVQALVDLQSLQSLTGRFDISDQGVLFDVTLRLDEGHRNLIYNFLRRPAIDPATLRTIPAGAAGFLTMALNEAPERYGKLSLDTDEPAIVTALDIGREIFANINGIAVCALPPDGSSSGPIPDIAAIITVNDPAKSQALWCQILGIASMAGGAFTMDGVSDDVEGFPVQSYQFAEAGLTVHFATADHTLVIATTETALAQTLATHTGDDSILEDEAFEHALARLTPSTTIAAAAHPARCAEIAKPFMSSGDIAEMEPVTDLMTETVAAFFLTHSNQELTVAAALTGLPDISEFVAAKIAEERGREMRRAKYSQAVHQGDWDEALQLLDEQRDAGPDKAKLLRKKFDLLAVHKHDTKAAAAVAQEMFELMHDHANSLNNFAWALLTEDKYRGEFNTVALEFSRRSNEITKHENWAYLDTLALAEFETGNADRAIELQEQALKICQKTSKGSVPALEKTLARFQAADRTE